MADLRQAAQQLLDAVESAHIIGGQAACDKAVAAVRTALAEPQGEPVALEKVYETIIQWDEGGGKRSRRELARRIVALAEQPAQKRPQNCGTGYCSCIECVMEPEPQEPNGLPLVIAGAIFDFAGYMTTRSEIIKVGSTANAGPVVDLVKEWAKLRGLSLDDAAVLSWQEWLYAAPQPRPEVDLTDEEIIWAAAKTKSAEPGRDGYVLPITFARAVIEAHKEKNK